MSRIRQFLTPGWVLTAVLAIGFAYLAFTVLAPWQLGKNADTRERNAQLTHAFEVDPVPAAELFPADGELPEGTEWRRVTVRGEYLPDREVLLRNRPVDGSPATHALTPFRADDGSVYLVNRGFEVPADGGIPDVDPAPSGKVELLGHARRGELPAQTPPLEGGPGEPWQVYSIDTSVIAGLIDTDIRHDYIQLTEGQPGGLRPIPLPTLESGPYLAYGIQWIFFGIMAPLAVVWFVYAEVRERRRDRAEQEAMLAADHGAAQVSLADDPATRAAAPVTGAADRTGDDGAGAPGSGPAEDSAPVDAPTAGDGAGDGSADGARDRAGDRADDERARRLAQRYGSSGHRAGRYGRDKGERF